MAARSVQPGAMQQLHPLAPMAIGIAEQLLNSLAHFECRGGPRHGASETQRKLVRNAVRDFQNEAPAFKAEDTAPDLAQTHRHNRRIDVLHDPLEAPAERQQLSDARDLAFGENTYDFAGGDGV